MITSINEKRQEVFFLIAIFIFPWLFLVFQGLYIPEFGYWLVNYENFFDNPEVAQTAFWSWLTVFIGALVNFFVGSFGVIGFKIANVLIIYLILYTVYQLLSIFTSKTRLLFFLLIAEIFINISTYTFINYYSLSTLFFLVSALFLYRGITQNKKNFLFMAGIVLGLNIFIRFPNLLGIGLLLALVYYDLAVGKFQYKYTFKRIIFIITGFIIAIFSVLLFMKAIGHYNLYMDSMAGLFGSISNTSSAHSGTSLINLVVKGHYATLKYGLLLFVSLFMILISSKYWLEKKSMNKIITLFLIVFMVFSLIKLSHVEYSNYHQTYIVIVGLIYGCLLWITYSQFKTNPNFGVIALMSFLIIEIIPMGSAAGLHQSIYGMYLAIPLIFVYIFSLKRINIGYFKITEKSIKYLGTLISAVLLIYSMLAMNFYRAPGLGIKRWTMFTSIDHPHLRGTFVTKEKAETLNDLIMMMDRYSKNLSYILTYEKISTVNYLSELKPYLNNTYPFFMTIDNLKKDLERESKSKTLPMVVRAKSVSTQKGWPEDAEKIDKLKGSKKHIEMRTVFESFLKKNKYLSVWENNDFEILIPSKIAKIDGKFSF